MEPTQIRKIAKLARLQLEDQEASAFSEQLGGILAFFEKLQQLPTAEEACSAHPPDLVGPTRKDQPLPYPNPAGLVERAAASDDGCYEVPPILAQE